MNLIQDLGSRGEKLLNENLSHGEEIKIKLKGQAGQAFVVTNKRFYILKWGIQAGNTFGGRVNTFEFTQVSGIEIQKGFLTGTLEILTPANRDTKYGGVFDVKSMKSDSAIRILRRDFSIFLEAVKFAREMLSPQTTSDHKLSDDLEASLEKLSSLKKKGLITEEEYQTKRTKMLGL